MSAKIEDRDEKYWLYKYPEKPILYDSVPCPGGGKAVFDLRRFVWPDDATVQAIIAEKKLRPVKEIGFHSCVQQVQRLVCDSIKYVGDDSLGAAEHWLFPNQLWARKTGDCEDGALLTLAILLHLLPEEARYRVRVTCGWVRTENGGWGGHAYVTVVRPGDEATVAADWCYLADPQIALLDKKPLNDRPEYGKVWFSLGYSMGKVRSWSHMDGLRLAGRVRGFVSADGPADLPKIGG
jgi:hypothetical protein